MIESLVSAVGQRGVDAAAFLLAFALTALTDSLFHNKLPTTMAVNLPSMAACPRARPAVPA